MGNSWPALLRSPIALGHAIAGSTMLGDEV